MIDSPCVLLIGAFEKHSGKTTLSEKIVRKFADNGIYAVKITILRSDEEIEKYSITEDSEIRPDKDTGRLKLAGAVKVFWVRCAEFSAQKAIEEVLSMIPAGYPVLCESNMARKYMKPAVFVMVARDIRVSTKDTAAAVEKFADMITVSQVADGKLIYKPDVCDLLKWEDRKWKLADR
ncbi:MAG TPA: hypothetical protein PKG52_05815 [bacterium]|nr:hypothetical protein [bacterium]